MLQLLILIIIIFVVFFSFKMHMENQSNEVDLVTSKYDQKKYLVRNLPDKEKAAELLSMIRERLTRLVEYLDNKYPTDSRIVQLTEKFNPDHITESSMDSAYTSYSVNKGEKIVFCLRHRDADETEEQENLIDINTMMFVAIHELAHIMTSSIGHNKEFWDNMRFLLDAAMSNDLKIYRYQPFHLAPKPYCGITISDTPLKM